MKAVIAQWVREDNIDHVNSISAPVHPRNTFYTRVVKRSIDIIFSLLAIAVTLPINLVIGAVTFFDVGKPIFFRQARAGMNGKLFNIVKFRNMRETVDENGVLLPPEKRVTKWGKFVRKTSLDELLNFYSVLRGDMSLIGPRPLPDTYLCRYSDRHKMRLSVRPGLECPPRHISGYDGTWQQRFENDIWYAEHVSLWTDLLMVFKLIQYTVNKRFAKKRGAAKSSSFIGYNEEGIAIDLNEAPLEYVVKVLEMNGIDTGEAKEAALK